jgi:hypothetical protein
MGKFFFALFNIVLSGAFKKILLGAGITLISNIAIKALINNYINDLIISLNNGLSDCLSLLAISGFDTFFSVMIGAFIAKVTISSAKLSFSKA